MFEIEIRFQHLFLLTGFSNTPLLYDHNRYLHDTLFFYLLLLAMEGGGETSRVNQIEIGTLSIDLRFINY